MWLLIALVLVVVLGGCAVAIGDRSVATVNTRADNKREVASDSATIEDVLLQKENLK